MAQWIRLPKWVDSPELDYSSKAILILLYSNSFFNDGNYSGIKYTPSLWCSYLKMSESTMHSKLKILFEKGVIKKQDDKLFLMNEDLKLRTYETPKIEVEKVGLRKSKSSDCENRSHALQKSKPVTPKIEVSHYENRSLSPLIARLEKGFKEPLVFLKYLYSNITIVSCDDFVNIILNCQDYNFVKEARKMKNKPPLFTAMSKSKRFTDAVKWMHEVWDKDGSKGVDYKTMPLKDYIIYSFIDAIFEEENPMGRFIKLVDDLKTSKKRIPFGLLNDVLRLEEEELGKANLQKRIENTGKMFGESKDWIASRKTEAEERKKTVEENIGKHPDIAEQAASDARVVMKVMPGKKIDDAGNPLDQEAREFYNRTFEIKFCNYLKAREQGHY